MFKSFILFLLAFIFFGSLYAQNPLLKKGNYKNAQIKIMKVDNFQTEQYLQTEGNYYINDFLILETYDSSRKHRKKILKLLLDSSTYLNDVNRACPFIAKYALEITSKNSKFEIIISGKSCPKVLINDAYSQSIISIDLRKNCSIYTLVEKAFEAN